MRQFSFLFGCLAIFQTSVFAQGTNESEVIRLEEIIIRVAPLQPSVTLFEERKQMDFDLLNIRPNDFVGEIGRVDLKMFLPKQEELNPTRISKKEISLIVNKNRN